jgi:hypothetical protein
MAGPSILKEHRSPGTIIQTIAKGDAGNTQSRVLPASGLLFLSVLISYGTIAATSLEYKLSLLLASTAVTT